MHQSVAFFSRLDLCIILAVKKKNNQNIETNIEHERQNGKNR